MYGHPIGLRRIVFSPNRARLPIRNTLHFGVTRANLVDLLTCQATCFRLRIANRLRLKRSRIEREDRRRFRRIPVRHRGVQRERGFNAFLYRKTPALDCGAEEGRPRDQFGIFGSVAVPASKRVFARLVARLAVILDAQSLLRDIGAQIFSPTEETMALVAL